MKKLILILTATIIAVASVSCRSKSEEVKKLPSKMIIYSEDAVDSEEPILGYVEYFYDEQTRLIKIAYIWENRFMPKVRGEELLEIAYNSDNLPVKLSGLFDIDIIYQDSRRKIILSDDTLWLNDKGQVTNIFQGKYSSFSRPFIGWAFGRNDDGSSTKIDSTYFDVPSIFRHVNTPEWLLFWLSNRANLLEPWQEGELDADNYVIKADFGSKLYFKYEYILAK